MHKNHRTLWTEGMFLGPQHFQQHDRFLLNTINEVAKAMAVYPYGLTELEIDKSALSEGKFAITRLSGFFPDGTPFKCPDDAELPDPLVIDSDCRDTLVSIALPFDDQQDKDAAESRSDNSFARYTIGDRAVNDRHSPDSDSEETVFTGSLWTRLTLAGEDHTAFHTIPLARIKEKRDDESVRLDPHFFPCAMTLNASEPLQTFVKELLALVTQRAKELAGSMGTATASDAAQLNQLLLLQILNRTRPLLKHSLETQSLTPEGLYAFLIQLAGELSTITQQSKLCPDFVEYLHRDQQQTFAPLIDTIKTCLNWIPDTKTESFTVQHVKAGIYTASIRNAALIESSTFILAAKARITPDELSKRFPRQTTISSKPKLRELVEAQAQGIALRPLVTVPNSIPTYENYVYFEMRSDDPLWREIATSGDIALHIAGSYSELTMQLWAIGK